LILDSSVERLSVGVNRLETGRTLEKWALLSCADPFQTPLRDPRGPLRLLRRVSAVSQENGLAQLARSPTFGSGE
jgi:hypothetical protein